ncbi:MAG: alanine racemase [Bifidobacteriaceae bacterium]|jgi:alanine racemase|nr:alanine racemase [Bifidobacteriaceae bacterium]
MSHIRAVINLDAVRHNTARLIELAQGAGVMAVVKANAYGHGILPVARAAIEAGATWLGVAQLDEAVELAAKLEPHRGNTRILAWLYHPEADFAGAVAAGVDLAVSSLTGLDGIGQAIERTQPSRTNAANPTSATTPARVHLKLDTGLGRAGAPGSQWPDLVKAALRLQSEGLIVIEGVWSHFAYADDPGNPTIAGQITAFEAGIELARSLGARFKVRHLANSAALATALPVTYDLVRPGLALYGLSPIPQVASASELGLVGAMALESYLSLVKPVPGGQGLSYGHSYITPRDTITGIVPVGYADGLFRSASNHGPVRVGGRNLAVAGRICMDQFVLDLGLGALDQAGDRVVLFGPGLDGEPTVQDWADAAGTIAYEITTRLPGQIERYYVGRGTSGGRLL